MCIGPFLGLGEFEIGATIQRKLQFKIQYAGTSSERVEDHSEWSMNVLQCIKNQKKSAYISVYIYLVYDVYSQVKCTIKRWEKNLR